MSTGSHDDSAQTSWGSAIQLFTAAAAWFFADVALLAIGWNGTLPIFALLAIHLAFAPLVWAATRNCDPTVSALAIVSMSTMGPVGAIGTLVIAMSLAFSRQETSEASLANWHRKLANPVQFDLAQRLTQAIEEDRLTDPSSIQTASFDRVSNQGTVLQRQTVLGIVSQRFDPSFSAVLKKELTSEEPAVRVSAAAVYTKLRDKNRLLMSAGGPLDSLLRPDEALDRGIALARGVQSGLLNSAELGTARRQSLELLLVARPRATEADDIEAVISTFLFEEGHLQALQERLGAIDLSSSSILRNLYTRVLLKTGQMVAAAEVLRHRQGNSVRLNLTRRPDTDQALLSPRIGNPE